MDEIDAVRAVLARSHADLAAFALSITPGEETRGSYCTEWSVAQVYSHLGSGAEIEVARIRAALSGEPPLDPAQIWQRWNALTHAEMISGFASADAHYLQLIDELDLNEVGDVEVAIDSFRVPLRTAMVLRLTEHALHSWDIYVAFNPDAEVARDAADLLIDLYPREIISLFASLQVAGKLGSASLRFDIAEPRRTQMMTFGESVTLTDSDGLEGGATGHLGLPMASAWARLLTGRLDDDHLPPAVTSTGTPTFHDLRTALKGDPLAA